jgi:hypothetical protein
MMKISSSEGRWPKPSSAARSSCASIVPFLSLSNLRKAARLRSWSSCVQYGAVEEAMVRGKATRRKIEKKEM